LIFFSKERTQKNMAVELTFLYGCDIIKTYKALDRIKKDLARRMATEFSVHDMTINLSPCGMIDCERRAVNLWST
jgi:hypothetical protein